MIWSALLLFAALLVVATGHLGTQFVSLFSGAPYVPSSDARVRTMLRLSSLQPGERAADLGSGDGRLVIAAAALGAAAVGYEMNPLLNLRARLLAWRAGLGQRTTFRTEDFLHADLAGYDVVFCYLLSPLMAKVEEKLWRELRPGARIVVNAFPLPHGTPAIKEGGVYVYEKRA